jgi:mono/diheme cytochrome c family protein
MFIALVFASAPVLMSQQKPVSPASGGAPVELSGKEMFKTYCATCHGEDAKGHGPATAALKVAPPDLTQLAKRNHGTFPSAYVNNVIVHGVNTPAHGSASMPIWGAIFVGINDQRTIVVRVNRLCDYLETLQAK